MEHVITRMYISFMCGLILVQVSPPDNVFLQALGGFSMGIGFVVLVVLSIAKIFTKGL